MRDPGGLQSLPAATGRAPPLGGSWGGSGKRKLWPGRHSLATDWEHKSRVGWILTAAPPGSASISTPRPGAGGWEGGISQRGGSRVPGQPSGPFCLRRERGNGKGGEEAGVRCAAPGPVQTPRILGPQRTGSPAADRPASCPSSALGTPARLGPAGWPPAGHRARSLGRHTEHSGIRVWGALSVFRGRSTWMPGGSHPETERASHRGTLGWPAARRYSWKAPCARPPGGVDS